MSAGGGGQGMGGGFDSSGSLGLGVDAFDGPGISAADLAALDKAMFDEQNMMAQHEKVGWKDDYGLNFNAPLSIGTEATDYGYAATVPGMAVIGGALANYAASLEADKAKTSSGVLAGPSVNPHAGFDSGVSGAGIETHGKLGHGMIRPGHIGSLVQGPDYPGLTPAQFEQESWSPYGTDWGGYLGAPVTNEQRGNRATIEPIGAWNRIDPRQQAIGKHFGIDKPQTAPQEDIDALMNEVLGVDLDVFNLDRAMVSNYAGNPWDSAISPISHSDTMREYESRVAAERALYAQIAQQITQASGQSGGGTPSVGTPSVGPPVVAPPVVGPPVVGPPTVGPPVVAPPQEPRNPQPPRGGREAANDPTPEPRNPIDTLVRAMLAPKSVMRQLAPHARKALRQGRMPDFSTLPDAQQDLVTQILTPPSKPLMRSDR